jgi:hypothetical protein
MARDFFTEETRLETGPHQQAGTSPDRAKNFLEWKWFIPIVWRLMNPGAFAFMKRPFIPTTRPCSYFIQYFCCTLLLFGLTAGRSLAAGSVVAWGDNSSLQSSVPSGLTNAIAVAGGTSHSLG